MANQPAMGVWTLGKAFIRDDVVNDLPADNQGSHPLVSWTNRLKQCVLRRTILPGIGYRVKPTETGVILEFNPTGISATIKRYRLKSVQGDYLTCRTWDGTNEGSTDIKIAKNFKLRNSITSAVIAGTTVSYAYGSTTQRTATASGATAETQVVVPYYLVNDEIYAMGGDSGVTVSSVKLTLIDLNLDGRAWATV